MAKGIAVITGSNGLTGQAICKNLQDRGYTVVGFDIAATGNGGYAYRQCDVTKIDQIKAAVEHVDSEYGTINVLVNNAGV